MGSAVSASERAIVLQTIVGAVKPSPQVYAAWLEGSDAMGYADAYSDLDLWLDVADGAEDAVFALIRRTLLTLGELDIDYEREHPHPQIRQAFFHVAHMSPYLLVDLCIQAHSRDRRATSFIPDLDGVKVLFDKAQVVMFVEEKPWEDPQQQLVVIRQEFSIFQRWVEKCLHRGDFLEALAAYHHYTLEPLVTLLRLHYIPAKADYHLKHSRQDLPAAVVARLERLYGVSSLAEIATAHAQACVWFQQLLGRDFGDEEDV
ncbi:MAG: nucleotidyltransferase domain-containing protein [Caldilineaceae bacterium]